MGKKYYFSFFGGQITNAITYVVCLFRVFNEHLHDYNAKYFENNDVHNRTYRIVLRSKQIVVNKSNIQSSKQMIFPFL